MSNAGDHIACNTCSGHRSRWQDAVRKAAKPSPLYCVQYANVRFRTDGPSAPNWVRRCAETWRDGRYVLEQETNAYAVLPASQWRGYREPPEAPPPAPGTWGDHPVMPSLLAQATADRQAGGTIQGAIGILMADPTDRLAMALARLGRAVQGANPQ